MHKARSFNGQLLHRSSTTLKLAVNPIRNCILSKVERPLGNHPNDTTRYHQRLCRSKLTANNQRTDASTVELDSAKDQPLGSKVERRDAERADSQVVKSTVSQLNHFPHCWFPMLVAARKRTTAAIAVQAPKRRPASGVTVVRRSVHSEDGQVLYSELDAPKVICDNWLERDGAAVTNKTRSIRVQLTLIRLAGIYLLALLERHVVLHHVVHGCKGSDEKPVRQKTFRLSDVYPELLWS